MNLTLNFELNAEQLQQPCAALTYLLSRANTRLELQPLEAWVYSQAGLSAAPDLPMAPLAASADGLSAHKGYWLRADPVHLVLQRDSFSLAEPVPLMVTAEHAQALLTSLNDHFSQDGLHIVQGHSGAWYMQANQSPNIKTTLPGAAVGKNIHPLLPQGESAAQWRAILNEVQMLLFMHPANAEREAQGLLPVNSLWLSGGGTLPEPLAQKGDEIFFADSPIYTGLAKHLQRPCKPVPAKLNDCLLEKAVHTVVHVEANYAAWAEAALNALKQRKIDQLTLQVGVYDTTLVATVRPRDLYRFWRRPRPLASYWGIA